MKVFSDDYQTVVARDIDEAEELLLSNDGEYECDLEEVDPEKKTMYFPLDELPQEYHDKTKYPISNVYGYVGVEITLAEAMRYTKNEPPYILSISGDLL